MHEGDIWDNRNRPHEHCWHAGLAPWVGASSLTTFPELCCRCSPSYIRLTITVDKLTYEHQKYSSEHPIYNFEESPTKVQTVIQG